MLHVRYSFYVPQVHRLIIRAEFVGFSADDSVVRIALPRWRPGRYELGHFERNIKRVRFMSTDGKPLPARKISRNEWEVTLDGHPTFVATYEYYARDLTAGTTYVDDQLWLITFVNCCLYTPDQPATCEVNVALPAQWQAIATVPFQGEGRFIVKSYDELFDTALLVAPAMYQHQWTYRGLQVGVNIVGVVHDPPIQMLQEHITQIIEEEWKIFRHFPTRYYQFLYVFPPFRKYHGVEHLGGTVILLGPAHHLFEEYLHSRFYTYKHLLGISAHEFFHIWNVKSIRPREFEQINYLGEVYTELGFFMEGVTTYYGELILLRAGLLPLEVWAEDFSRILTRFFHNYGRFNKSLAESSFDLLIDGYQQHIPHRTTSIYTHGALVSFLLDVYLRKVSDNRYSLDTLLHYLYHEFARQGKGFTADDLRAILHQWGGEAMVQLFNRYVFAMPDIEQDLAQALAEIGMRLYAVPMNDYVGLLGMKVDTSGKVIYLLPNEGASQYGLAYDDQIVAVEDVLPKDDLPDWLTYFARHQKQVRLTVARQGRQLTLTIPVASSPLLSQYHVIVEGETPLRRKWLQGPEIPAS